MALINEAKLERVRPVLRFSGRQTLDHSHDNRGVSVSGFVLTHFKVNLTSSDLPQSIPCLESQFLTMAEPEDSPAGIDTLGTIPSHRRFAGPGRTDQHRAFDSTIEFRKHRVHRFGLVVSQ